jgi:hypothetical protein
MLRLGHCEAGQIVPNITIPFFWLQRVGDLEFAGFDPKKVILQEAVLDTFRVSTIPSDSDDAGLGSCPGVLFLGSYV